MSDIKIDPIITDITFVNGQLVTGSMTDDIKQRVRDSLSTLIGEWFLDLTYGFDWINIVFTVKNPSLAVIEAAIKVIILNAANSNLPSGFIVDITDFSITLNRNTRKLSIDYTLGLGTIKLTDTLSFAA